jgi:hypothetical protein
MFGISFIPNIVLSSIKHHFHRTCSQKPLALDCENSEDVPNDSEEQFYKEPDLSG